MYFVDREQIEEILVHMETLIEYSEQLSSVTNETEQLALERMVAILIEGIIDVGNRMIDGFIMRDPGSYEDIIHILDDEKVVTAEDAQSLKKVIRLRRHLVQEYTKVNHVKLLDTLNENKDALKQFPKEVRRYLVEELGPVSAFLPTEEEKK